MKKISYFISSALFIMLQITSLLGQVENDVLYKAPNKFLDPKGNVDSILLITDSLNTDKIKKLLIMEPYQNGATWDTAYMVYYKKLRHNGKQTIKMAYSNQRHEFFPFTKEIKTIDKKNHSETTTLKRWDGKKYVDWNRKIQTKDKYGNHLVNKSEVYKNNRWVIENGDSLVYSINKKGQAYEKFEFVFYSSDSLGWREVTKTEVAAFDSKGYPTKLVQYAYGRDGYKMEAAAYNYKWRTGFETISNSGPRPTEGITQIFNKDSVMVDSLKKSSIVYEDLLRVQYVMIKKNGDWVLKTKNVYKYDYKKNLIGTFYYNLKDNKWEITEGSEEQVRDYKKKMGVVRQFDEHSEEHGWHFQGKYIILK